MGFLGCLAASLMLATSLAAQRIERPALDITGYLIDAEIDTAAHHLTAKSQVSFTAPETLDLVSFGFHPALKVTKITDDTGKLLNGERSADGTIRVTPAAPFVKGQTNRWTFEYDGAITGNEDGIKHCSMDILYAMQHIGYMIPPQADCGWIGAAGPGPLPAGPYL